MPLSTWMQTTAMHAEAHEALRFLDGKVQRCFRDGAMEMVRLVTRGDWKRGDIEAVLEVSGRWLERAARMAEMN